MERHTFRDYKETLEGEQLKKLMEFGLGALAHYRYGETVFEFARGGERLEDPRLHNSVAGLKFENPVMVGAGWDKTGRAVDGLYRLGFSGAEVGTVLPFDQYGNPKPRLFTDKSTHSVGLNRLGFNSLGVDAVYEILSQQQRNGITGISLGKNKIIADEFAPEAHATVAAKLYDLGDYFVINVSSPNTPGLRNLLNPQPLTDIIQAVQAVLNQMVKPGQKRKPLFVKTTIDLAQQDLDLLLQVLIDQGVDGIIDTNTTIDDTLKARYGWQGQMGGLSGNDPDYRKRANDRMKYITRATSGTGLQRIGVGGIHDATTAIERMEAGAQIVQVVTGIRHHKGRTAHNINKGILTELERRNMSNVDELVGIAA